MRKNSSAHVPKIRGQGTAACLPPSGRRPPWRPFRLVEFTRRSRPRCKHRKKRLNLQALPAQEPAISAICLLSSLEPLAGPEAARQLRNGRKAPVPRISAAAFDGRVRCDGKVAAWDGRAAALIAATGHPDTPAVLFPFRPFFDPHQGVRHDTTITTVPIVTPDHRGD